MVIALGALGPVVRITLDIEPSYQVQQDGYANLTWDAIVDHFDQVSNAGYSVSVMTAWNEPTARQVWVKTRLDDDRRRRTNLGDVGATPIPVADLGHGANMNPFGSPGPWSRRLPHFRLDSTPGRGHEIQVEWMVPRPALRPLLLALREQRVLIDSMLGITELRTVAGDDQWLSTTRARTWSACTSPAIPTPTGCSACCTSSNRFCSRRARARTGANSFSPPPPNLRPATRSSSVGSGCAPGSTPATRSATRSSPTTSPAEGSGEVWYALSRPKRVSPVPVAVPSRPDQGS
jgi:hypothetical protein